MQLWHSRYSSICFSLFYPLVPKHWQQRRVFYRSKCACFRLARTQIKPTQTQEEQTPQFHKLHVSALNSEAEISQAAQTFMTQTQSVDQSFASWLKREKKAFSHPRSCLLTWDKTHSLLFASIKMLGPCLKHQGRADSSHPVNLLCHALKRRRFSGPEKLQQTFRSSFILEQVTEPLTAQIHNDTHTVQIFHILIFIHSRQRRSRTELCSQNQRSFCGSRVWQTWEFPCLCRPEPGSCPLDTRWGAGTRRKAGQRWGSSSHTWNVTFAWNWHLPPRPLRWQRSTWSLQTLTASLWKRILGLYFGLHSNQSFISCECVWAHLHGKKVKRGPERTLPVLLLHHAAECSCRESIAALHRNTQACSALQSTHRL